MSANSATLTEVPLIPRKRRRKEKIPDPKIPEWPKELKDLCMEFQDVLVEKLESAQQATSGSKTILCTKTKKESHHWKEKVKEEVQKLIKQ